MWGNSSYLLTIFIFAGSVTAIEVIFGFHFFKKYLKVIGLMVLVSLVLTPLEESSAYFMQLWSYNPATTFYRAFLGAEVETYVFAIFCTIAVSCVVIIWTSYEDKRKNILRQSFKDIFKGTYAIWRKKK